jgi:hypothetical protein
MAKKKAGKKAGFKETILVGQYSDGGLYVMHDASDVSLDKEGAGVYGEYTLTRTQRVCLVPEEAMYGV